MALCAQELSKMKYRPDSNVTPALVGGRVYLKGKPDRSAAGLRGGGAVRGGGDACPEPGWCEALYGGGGGARGAGRPAARVWAAGVMSRLRARRN